MAAVNGSVSTCASVDIAVFAVAEYIFSEIVAS